MQDKPLGLPKIGATGNAIVPRTMWQGAWQFAITNPKTSLGFAAMAFLAIGGLLYQMKHTEFSFGSFFKSKPKDTSQKGGDVKGKLGAEATQRSAESTIQEVGNVESSDGKATLNQKMGYKKN